MPRMDRRRRREDILQAFAAMLETHPGSRITTAALASRVGVSEAALYRHFPSKAKMIDGLIEFAEDTVFTRVAQIQENDAATGEERCGKILALLLGFCERNPGFARLFAGDALQGETERLRQRIRQFFDRIETELRQIMREVHAVHGRQGAISATAAANLMLATCEGRITQFVRSEFRSPPTKEWSEQWRTLAAALF